MSNLRYLIRNALSNLALWILMILGGDLPWTGYPATVVTSERRWLFREPGKPWELRDEGGFVRYLTNSEARAQGLLNPDDWSPK